MTAPWEDKRFRPPTGQGAGGCRIARETPGDAFGMPRCGPQREYPGTIGVYSGNCYRG